MIRTKKAQIALEALIIFGVITVGVILFGLFFLSASRNTMFSDSKLSTDKTTGQSLNDNLESAFNYRGDSQIDSSSIGLEDSEGHGPNTGDNYGDIFIISDPESDYYCGDNICLTSSENIFNCPEDCGVPFYKDFSLELLEPIVSKPKEAFEIKISISTNDYSLIIERLEIFDSSNNPTNNCSYEGKNSSIFYDLGQLKEIGKTSYRINKEFYCESEGNYNFKFTLVSRENKKVTPFSETITKTIETPTIIPPLLLISPNLFDSKEPLFFKGKSTDIFLSAKLDENLRKGDAGNYEYVWIFKDKITEKEQEQAFANNIWLKNYPASKAYSLFVRIKEKGKTLVESEPVLITFEKLETTYNNFIINSPVKESSYPLKEEINFKVRVPDSFVGIPFCTWYYYNINEDVFEEFKTENGCISFDYPASEFKEGEILFYVLLKTKAEELIDTKMTKITIKQS